MSRYIVYGLCDPRTNQIRYIGKTSKGLTRPRSHARRAHLEATHKAAWIRSLLRDGLSYEIEVLEECASEQELSQAEIFWIAYFRFVGADLTNGTAGGDGLTNPSSETRRRISEAMHRRQVSATTRAKLSAAGRGRRCGPVSAATRAKLSVARRARKVSDAQRKRIATAMQGNNNAYGKRRAPDAIARMSTARGGRPFTDDKGRRYNSISEAARATNTSRGNIYSVLQGKRKSAGGLVFRYLPEVSP